jgi:hypothetical protein
MASGIYDVFKEDLMDASVNLAFGQDALRVALMTTGHTASTTPADFQTDAVWADVSADEIAGTGYTANGELLANQSVAVATGVATFDGDDTTWVVATFSAYHAVIYDATNANSLICSIDFGGIQSVAGGTFTIEWNSSGIISLT